MATSKVVGGILLAADELLRVKQLSVRSCADLIYHGGLQIQKHCSRHVLVSSRLRKEGAECIISLAQASITWHLPIWLHPHHNIYHHTIHQSQITRISKLHALFQIISSSYAESPISRATHLLISSRILFSFNDKSWCVIRL